MVSSCWAPGCTCRMKKGASIKMYRFPLSDSKRRDLWVRKCNRLPPPGEQSVRSDGLYEPNEYARLCACCHFVKGIKAAQAGARIAGCKSDDPQDVDYVPSIFAHTSAMKKNSKHLQQCVNRYSRKKDRDHRMKLEVAEALISLHKVPVDVIKYQTGQSSFSGDCNVAKTGLSDIHVNACFL